MKVGIRLEWILLAAALIVALLLLGALVPSVVCHMGDGCA